MSCNKCQRSLHHTSPSGLIQTNSAYKYGYICNKCRATYSNHWSHHCSYCEYDLCESCYKKNANSNYYKIYSRPKYDTSSSRANCPKKHGLKGFNTRYRGYSCDGCKQRNLPKGTFLFGCRTCNFDLCRTCYHKGKNTNSKAKDDCNENGHYKIYSRPKYDTSSSKRNNKLTNNDDEKKFVAMIQKTVDENGQVTIKPDNHPYTYTISRKCKQSDKNGHKFKNYKNGVSICESCGLKKQSNTYGHSFKNDQGRKVKKGYTGKYYCGVYFGKQYYGHDGYCGPNNGKECSSCAKYNLYH